MGQCWDNHGMMDNTGIRLIRTLYSDGHGCYLQLVSSLGLHVYIYIHIYIYCKYVYIYRERDGVMLVLISDIPGHDCR